MGKEINLLEFYPVSNRPIDERGDQVTETERAIARKFDREYFDGDRLTGYGGYSYHSRFWTCMLFQGKKYLLIAHVILG